MPSSMKPANQKIPYAYMTDKLYPNAFLQLLMPAAFNGRIGDGEILEAYDGVLPLLLAGIGIWRSWNNRWVKYFSAMGAISYIYALGDISFLNGILYAIVPELWMAREAPRAMYLTDFALVILVGFGVQALFYEWRQINLPKLTKILNWAAIAVGVILAVPALFGKPELSPWNSFSLILILISCATCRYILAGHRGLARRA
jgi:hypothetical protein